MPGLLGRLDEWFGDGKRRQEREKRDAQLATLSELLNRGRRTYSGVPVDDDQALRLGAVWACVDLLAEIISTLPVDEYRRAQGGPPSLLPSSPLLVDPAGDGSGFEVWCRQVMTSFLLRGNTFGFVEGIGPDMWPTQIEILHPDRVSIRRDTTFGPSSWFLDGKAIERWPMGPLWHVAAYPALGSPMGMSPIRYAAETIGLGVATRKFGAQWFGDGAHPTAVIESDLPLSEEEAKLLQARIEATLSDSRRPLALGGGATLKSIQVAPEESQFLETSQANVADIARFFRVPPEMIGGKAADNLTYANQEQRSIAFLTYTVGPWLVRIERALSRLLPRGRFVKFNADALLRVDLKTRYESHVLAVRGGIHTPNERRELEDYGPLPGGDQLLWPPFATSETPEGADGSTQPA